MSFAGKIVQLGYDQIVTTPVSERECSICLKANQVEALLAILEPMAWVTRWYSDDLSVVDQDSIEAFRDDIRRRLMSGCEDVPLTRFSSDGDYQTSSDGGTTFVNSPGQDPRNGYSRLPSLSGGDGNSKRCEAANSVITYFKNAVASIQKAKDNEATASDLGAVLVGLLLLLGIITVGWIFAFFGAFVAILYTNITAEGWAAAFNDDLWQQLLCIVYKHTEPDASYTVSDVKAIIGDIETEIAAGTAQSFLLDMSKSLWAGGMTTAARQALGGSLDCSCGACDLSHWTTVYLGSVVDTGDDYITLSSVHSVGTYGTERVAIGTGNINDCCCLSAWVVLSGGTGGAVAKYIACGSPVVDEGSYTHVTLPNELIRDANTVALDDVIPFTVKLIFVPCS